MNVDTTSPPTAEREMAQQVKEKMCYVAPKFQEEMGTLQFKRSSASVLQEAVWTGNEIIMADHVAHFQAVVREEVKRKEEAQQQLSTHLNED